MREKTGNIEAMRGLASATAGRHWIGPDERPQRNQTATNKTPLTAFLWGIPRGEAVRVRAPKCPPI